MTKKAINKKAKGQRIERLAKRLLEDEGYLVEKKNSSRYQSDDFWGEFDLVAVMPDTGNTRWIQIKSNMNHFYKARKSIEKWRDKHSAHGMTLEVWCWITKEEFRIDYLD